MTGTTISSSVTVGVTLTSKSQNPVTVTSAGTVTVSGIDGAAAVYAPAAFAGTVVNSGTLSSPQGYGVQLHDGGSITNGSKTDTRALITGGIYGVTFGALGQGSLTNFGTVSASNVGVLSQSAATVTNGSDTSAAALIAGYGAGIELLQKSTVTNFATIKGTGTASSGVYLAQGGHITNGNTGDEDATISGGKYGVFIENAVGTVTNFGSIIGTGSQGHGVFLKAGGLVTNGSKLDTSALIETTADHSGVGVSGAAGTVVNYGTIVSGSFNAVSLDKGGTVTNGSAADHAALISGGADGVYVDVPGTVTNFGTITGPVGVFFRSGTTGKVVNNGTISGLSGAGVYLGGGGQVINGSATLPGAAIYAQGGYAIDARNAPATITNFGLISFPLESNYATPAIRLQDGGTVTNGSAADRTAYIGGAVYPGIVLGSGNSMITNFGIIIGYNPIEFATGATGTIVNAGSIDTSGFSAIGFSTGANRLVIDPGSYINDKVEGNGGQSVLELASGTGTVKNFGYSNSQYVGFITLQIDKGGVWTTSGANAVENVDNLGTLILPPGGALDITGSVSSTSTGTFELHSETTLTIAADTGSADKIKFISTGVLVIGNPATFGTDIGSTSYKGPLIEDFVKGDTIELPTVTDGAQLTYNSSTGLLQVATGSTHYATLAFQASSVGSGTFQPGNNGSGNLMITLN